MKKNVLLWIGIFLLLAGVCRAENVTVLSEILKPTRLVVDANQLYVIEDTTIHIYSLPDYKYITKFGRAGEGPQEFNRFAVVSSHKDYLLVNSMGKLSFFTRDGKYRKELKTGAGMFNGGFLPLKDGFVGLGGEVKDDEFYTTINLYDSTLKKQNEISRRKSGFKRGGKIELLKGETRYLVWDNKVFITTSAEMKIDVVDHTGKTLYSVQEKYPRLKVTAKRLKELEDVLKQRLKGRYDEFKSRVLFPDYLPAIRNFHIKDNKLYVITYEGDNSHSGMFVFSTSGKGLKKTTVPIVMEDFRRAYPYDLGNGKLYQLVVNDDEDYELHVTEIK